MIGYKLIFVIIVLSLTACSTIQEARDEFHKDIDGFKREWARVVLKKEIDEN
jgi:hypothetical protein